MICVNTLFHVIMYTLGIILLIALIVLCFKMFDTLKRVDRMVDDLSDKASKLDNLFGIIDKSTDAISSFTDRIIELIVGTLVGLFSKKKKEKEIDENE